MKRIAIPIVKGELSPYFGQCNHYEIFDIEGEDIQHHAVEVPPSRELSDLPEWVAEQGITDVIAYRVDKQIIRLFSKYKIQLFIGIPVSSPESLIQDYLEGNLRSDSAVIADIMGGVHN